jgi:glycosyltransferase involved in cell wall biosynthesis
LHRIFLKLAVRKFNNYKLFQANSFGAIKNLKTHILIHLDDPEYSIRERNNLIETFEHCQKNSKRLFVVCTNQYTMDYLKSFLPKRSLIEAPQGFTEIFQNTISPSHRPFRIVYSSSIIDIDQDRRQGHSSWDATHLIDDLIPKIVSKLPDVEIHLIGRIGKNAKSHLAEYHQVTMHGLVSIKDNAEILSRCSLAIYPRLMDNRRSVQKISEYLGAGLPIVSYDLIDASLVKREYLGVCVGSPDEFINAIEKFYKDRDFYMKFVRHIGEIRNKYSWEEIADHLEIELKQKLNQK